MTEILDGLNPEQRRAVECLDGPLLILAGAGSGKTRVLTRRVAHLLERGTDGDGGRIQPWNVLAVTFTNKAAGEMRSRVHALVGDRARDCWISTFHSACVRILRRDIQALGYKRDFAIYDDDDQLRVIKQVLDEMKISPKELAPGAVRARIDRHKNGMERIGDDARGSPFPKLLELYDTRLRKAQALDFNDIINKVVLLWEEHPAVLDAYRRRFRYVMVDEYQDTNASQFRLVSLLAAPAGNIAVVGDDDQGIYSFRGADLRNILDFERHFPGATVVKLEQNYRSTATILRAASGLVHHNVERKEKTLRTAAADGELIRVLVSDDEIGEAETLAREVRRLLQRYRPADMAVIYRTNAQSRPFEQVFARERIPHVLVGGRKFYERMEVRDILAYLRVTLNPDDDVALLRVVNVPSRGLGDKAVESMRREASARGLPLREAARLLGQGSGRTANAFAGFTALLDGLADAVRHLPLGEFVLHVATRSGYLDALRAQPEDEGAARIDNVHELARAAGEDAEGGDLAGGEAEEERDAIGKLRAFMDRATLASPTDDLPEPERGAVTLLTAHLAKGLEFPVVFIVGMVEKCFPHARAEFQEAVEEERRLAYVGMTRARERLYLSYPMRRRAPEGWWDDATLSRFVRELPGDCLAWPPGVSPLSSSRARPAPAPAPAPWSRPSAPGRIQARPAIPSPAKPMPRAPVGPPAGRRVLKPETMEAFREGVEVLHPVLGVGTISRREGVPSNPRLTIHFPTHGPRTVFAVSAGLSVLLP